MDGSQQLAGSPDKFASNARRLLVAMSTLLVLVPVAFWLDSWATSGLQRMPIWGDLRRLIVYSEVFGHGLGVAFIILTAAVLDRRKWRCLLCLSIYAYGAGLLADAAKLLVARHRPYHDVDMSGPVWETFIGFLPWIHGITPTAEITSFPSAHAATAVGLAIGLSRLYPQGRILFMWFAFLASLQRVMSLSHFPSDVLAGAAVACGWSIVLAQRWSIPSKLFAAEPGRGIASEGSSHDSARRRCA